jgi:AraC-like DNA-binding protein
VKRAVELFAIESRAARSRFIERTWWAESVPANAFISVAACHWEICVTRDERHASVTVRGPESKASIVPIPPDAQFFGIEFTLGTYMPALPPRQLVDRAIALDVSEWELPTRDNVDALVDKLARAGLLVHDPIAGAAVNGDASGLSARSLERRVARATGLTRGAIRQIRRSEIAVELLTRGASARDAAGEAGYADQAHLTRSLKRLVGQTPAVIAASAHRA